MITDNNFYSIIRNLMKYYLIINIQTNFETKNTFCSEVKNEFNQNSNKLTLVHSKLIIIKLRLFKKYSIKRLGQY